MRSISKRWLCGVESVADHPRPWNPAGLRSMRLGCQKAVLRVSGRVISRAMVCRRGLSSCWGCGWSGRSSTWRYAACSSLWSTAGGRRTPKRSRSWSCATGWQSCGAASTHALGSSPRTACCLRRSVVSCPGPDGRSSWSHPRHCLDGTGTWCVGAGPTQHRGAAGHRFPSRCRP